MPSERFLKLRKDKQDRILDAARKEFARVPFEEASINQIIRDAEISRGSFYTYFEDKIDLLQYVFKDTNDSNTELMKEQVIRRNGDFYLALEDWLRIVVRYMDTELLQQSVGIFMQNAMNLQIRDFMKKKPSREEEKKLCEWILCNCGKACFGTGLDREHQEILVEMMQTLAALSALKIIMAPEYSEEVIRAFHIEMEFMKRGAGGMDTASVFEEKGQVSIS